jgi:hypothetical protein
VIKAADESVTSSTTLQDDDELFFATVSGAVYQLEVVIVYASPAGGTVPDMKVAFGEDAVFRGVLNAVYASATDAAASVFFPTDSTVAQLNVGTATTNRVILLTGWHVAGGGTFRFRWAQVSLNASPTIVRAGSDLRYRRTV